MLEWPPPQPQPNDCRICKACSVHADCGAGSYCGDSGQCFKACNVEGDCPGGDSTVCQAYDGFSACVNADHRSAGLCHANYVCGQVAAPTPVEPGGPEAQPVPETVDPSVDDDGRIYIPDERPGRTMTAGVECNGGGGCSTAPDSPVGPIGFAAFLALGVLRRRRFG